jgi:hypothetical protein
LPIEPKPIITMGPSKRASNAESVIVLSKMNWTDMGRQADIADGAV